MPKPRNGDKSLPSPPTLLMPLLVLWQSLLGAFDLPSICDLYLENAINHLRLDPGTNRWHLVRF